MSYAKNQLSHHYCFLFYRISTYHYITICFQIWYFTFLSKKLEIILSLFFNQKLPSFPLSLTLNKQFSPTVLYLDIFTLFCSYLQVCFCCWHNQSHPPILPPIAPSSPCSSLISCWTWVPLRDREDKIKQA